MKLVLLGTSEKSQKSMASHAKKFQLVSHMHNTLVASIGKDWLLLSERCLKVNSFWNHHPPPHPTPHAHTTIDRT
jgi:hypothetical protein